jgi:hypothetical protein
MSASNARPRPAGIGATVTPRDAAVTRLKSPAPTTPLGLPGPSSWRGWGSPRSTSTASDPSRARGIHEADRRPESERLCADSRKTRLQGVRQAFRVPLVPNQETGHATPQPLYEPAHPLENGRGSAMGRTIPDGGDADHPVVWLGSSDGVTAARRIRQTAVDSKRPHHAALPAGVAGRLYAVHEDGTLRCYAP